MLIGNIPPLFDSKVAVYNHLQPFIRMTTTEAKTVKIILAVNKTSAGLGALDMVLLLIPYGPIVSYLL